MNQKDPEYIVIDLFCGFGGVTEGFAMSGLAYTIAAVNHDEKAIESHEENHPDAIHFREDITKLYGRVINGTLMVSEQMKKLIRLTDIYRACYPNAKVIVWASAECTNYSKAKGGQSRDADSRTLPQHLDRYIAALDPDYFQVENVVEFMSWGPMAARISKSDDGYPCCKLKFEEISEDVQDVDEWGEVFTVLKKGKPVKRKSGKFNLVASLYPESKKNGKYWMKWKQDICEHFGYVSDYRQLNSADFGAYTSRNRLFMIFAKPGLPIAWPAPTHSKKPGKNGMFGDLKKWMPVKEVLDFSDEGTSIFNRKKPLVDPSLLRIWSGLVKFVAGGKESFILKYNSTNQNGQHRPPSVDEPCPTIAVQNRLGIVNTSFLAKYYSGLPSNHIKSIEQPADALTTIDHHSLVNTYFISQRNSGFPESRVISVEAPARTITGSGGNQDLVSVPFIMNTHFNNLARSIESPAPTLTASRHHPYVVNPTFLTQYYSSGGQLASIEEPARTLGTKDTIAKIQTSFFDMTYSGKSNVSSVEKPAGTIMPNDKHRLINCEGFILNPGHGGHATSIDAPGPVIIARQDKAPLYLIQYDLYQDVCIPVYPEDSEIMVKIKIFMAIYGISDIKMRMLKVKELLSIQGFPKHYKIRGTQTEAKKFIGNSVVPHVVEAMTKALANSKLKSAA